MDLICRAHDLLSVDRRDGNSIGCGGVCVLIWQIWRARIKCDLALVKDRDDSVDQSLVYHYLAAGVGLQVLIHRWLVVDV